MQGIVLILMISVIVEALIEYVKSVYKSFLEDGGYKTAATQLIAMALGIIICICAQADLLSLIGIDLGVPYMGYVLTGIFASRGANYVSDLVKRLTSYKEV